MACCRLPVHIRVAQVVVAEATRELARFERCEQLLEKGAPSEAATPALLAARGAALKRLMAYRYLVGLRYEDLELDPEFNFHCQAASRMLKVLGRLDHTPENPGLPTGGKNL